MEYGEHCGIAKQVEGKVVNAELRKDNLWHFEFGGDRWIASDYAFKEQNSFSLDCEVKKDV